MDFDERETAKLYRVVKTLHELVKDRVYYVFIKYKELCCL
jgi:hypothetical protein